MVLQEHYRRDGANAERIDLPRVIGISGAMAVNLVALGLLLIPAASSIPVVQEASPPQIQWTIPAKPIPQPPPPPDVVPVTKPRATPAPRIAQPVQAPVAPPLTFVDGDIAIEPVIADPAPLAAESALQQTGTTGPMTGMQLEYATAPAPSYPRDAARRGLEGTVLLEILVGVDGKPLDVRIHRSSGHSLLDREAQRHVLRTWTFRPAMQNGQAVQAIGIVPIDFQLSRM